MLYCYRALDLHTFVNLWSHKIRTPIAVQHCSTLLGEDMMGQINDNNNNEKRISNILKMSLIYPETKRVGATAPPKVLKCTCL